MQYFSIDSCIVYSILLVILCIGLWAGKGVKNLQEYALANKIFGTAALVLTWLATDIAGETVLDMAGSIRTEGIIQILGVQMGCCIAMLMQALFFAPKMVQFSGCLTLGDIVGKMYKGPTKIITGLLSCSTALCIAGMELTVLATLFECLLGIKYSWAIGIGGTLLVAYTVHGGMKSVAYTDTFQFLILFVVIPIITVTALHQAGGIQKVFSQVPATTFQIVGHPKLAHYIALFITLSIFQFSVIDPALMQRMLMGRSPRALRHQFLVVTVFLFGLMISLGMLGLASMVLYPEKTEAPIVAHLVRHLLPTGIKGLAIAGLLAITMSTFDSFLHAAGLSLVHDMVAPIGKHFKKTIDELSWTRWMTLGMGVVTMIVGWSRSEDLYGLVLLSYKFVGPVLAVPLFSGISGLKPDSHAFYIAGGVALVVLGLATFLLPEGYGYVATLMGTIANGITFFLVHFIRNKGFVVVHPKEKIMCGK